ncbi:MAG: DUF3291 domain-containing protein [Bacteroidota bacterium]
MIQGQRSLTSPCVANVGKYAEMGLFYDSIVSVIHLLAHFVFLPSLLLQILPTFELMEKSAYHLAQLNVARMLGPLDSLVMKEFADGLEPINALADSSPGFVWRLKDEGNETAATSYRPFDDDMIIVNMSVWEDLESLKSFVFNTDHKEFLKNRKQWFSRIKEAYAVMWWVPQGHLPDIAEAIARLKYLRKKGESEMAFSFRKVFDAPG